MKSGGSILVRAWLGATVLIAADSCGSPKVGDGQTRLGPEQTKYQAPSAEKPASEPQEGPLEMVSPLGLGSKNIERFAANLLRDVTKEKTIGVLPLVYDPTGSPSIPQLGVTAAEEIAREIRKGGHEGAILAPSEVGLFLKDLNVDKRSLFSLESITSDGDRLGFDVIVFGTMKKPNIVVAGRNPLEFEVEAFDVLQLRRVGEREVFRLENKSANRAAFQEVEIKTTWAAAKDLGASSTGPLEKEMNVVVWILANRIARLSGAIPAGPDKRIYVAPADSSSFVSSVAQLRKVQKSLWEVVEERERKTTGPGEPDPMSLPLVLGGLEYANVQQARDFVNSLQQDLLATESFRIGQTIASDLVEQLRPLMDPRQVFSDLGFVKLSDNDRVVGELATGGLVRGYSVRNLLKKEGVAAVIQPRFERIGDQFSLRVEIYDLENLNVPLSTHCRIDRRYTQELAKLLDVRDVKDQVASQLVPVTERQGWAPVNDKVKTGVVRLVGLNGANQDIGHGTGFLVAKDLVMTNSHVLHGIREAAGQAIELSNGKVFRISPLEVLADDEFQDVAVLRVKDLPSDIHVFEFAPGERARVGVDVAVIGHPKETEGQVFTAGILSSLDQKVMTFASRLRPSYMYTCPTRAGNSGSPVILMDGSVIAVNSHGKLGDVKAIAPTGASGAVVEGGGVLVTELPGFATGAPGPEAKRILEAAPKK